MEVPEYVGEDIGSFKATAMNQIHTCKLMIEQFTGFIAINEEEIRSLKSENGFYTEETLERIDVIHALNQVLEEAIDECLDLILRNQERLDSFEGLL